ncbi:hsp70 nucleotide exchange factor fes1 [Steccherinum ochraceum]|uniref:Hsp70 nucleotide exchange factor fes1 n=1 Tax=Steccherinum ochraceum TaxID=92696 RepID=A0A4R0RKS9_9APHY|nr:hsp70 nucleotide exchange factor fes1 [Steccherinum ochraceum]
MDSLLRWGIENSVPTDGQQVPPAQPRKDLDPAIIDHILGKPDAVLMKEALEVAVDETRDEDERLQALDDFEMLVEQIDNANDLLKLKMWEPLQSLLTSSSSSDEIRRQVLWIVGTAVQNNPSAQNAYLDLTPLTTLLSFLSPSVSSAKTRSKAVYALSGLLKHNRAAVRQMEDAGGWEVLKGALEDSDISVRRKTAFLLNSLLLPTTVVQTPAPIPSATSGANHSSSTALTLHPTAQQPSSGPEVSNPIHPNSHASMLSNPSSFSTSELTQAALEQRGILSALVGSLVSPIPYGPDGESEGDPELEEKVVNVLHTYVLSCHGQLSPDQKKSLARFIEEQSTKAGDDGKLAEAWGLAKDDLVALRQAL